MKTTVGNSVQSPLYNPRSDSTQLKDFDPIHSESLEKNSPANPTKGNLIYFPNIKAEASKTDSKAVFKQLLRTVGY